MRDYLARLRGTNATIKRFMLFTLIANIGFGIFQLIYNLYLVRLGHREDFIGAFTAINTVTMALFSLAIGPLIARFGTRRCIIAGAVTLSAGFLAQATVTVTPLLLASAALGGIGQAALMVPSMPFIIEHTRDDERADVSALHFSVLSLSMMAGSLIGGRLPGLLAWLGPVFAPGTVAAYRATLLASVALTVLGLATLLFGKQPRDSADDPAARRGGLLDAGHRTRQVRRDMANFVAVGALFSISVAAIMPFYNVYLQELGATTGLIGTIFALSGVCGALAGPLAPPLARRFGILRVAAWARAIGVPLIVLLIFLPSLPLAFAAQIVRTIGFSAAWPLDANLIADVLPPRQRASVFSLRSAAWNLSWAATSFAVGRLIVATGGYTPAFVTSAVFAVLALALFTGYFARHPHVTGDRAARAPAARREAAEADARV